MKQSSSKKKKGVLIKIVTAFALAALLGAFMHNLSITSYAATGTITKASVNIRKEPSTDSEKVGSVLQGDSVTVNSKTVGADGNTWYQVTVDANTVGYIRSDLMSVSGDVPDASAPTSPSDPAAQPQTPSVTVTPVQPVSASVTGSDEIHEVSVRWDAVVPADNMDKNIIARLAVGTTVTVNGQATDAEGNVWYQASFTDNGQEKQGFIRAEHLTLSGEVVPVNPEQPGTSSEENPGGTEPGATEEKPPYYTIYGIGENSQEAKWWLVQHISDTEEHKYDAEGLISYYNKTHDEEIPSLRSTLKTQKIFIVVLVVLLLAAVFGVVLLFFKIKDISDEAYFSSIEKEAIRERKNSRAERGKDAQPVTGKKPASGTESLRSGEGRQESGVRTQKSSSAQGRSVSSQGSQGRSVPSQGSQGRSVSSQGSQGRPVSSQGSQGRSVSSQGAQGRPVSSQGGQVRQVSSQGSQGRPVSSQGSQGRPVSGQGSQGRPVSSQGSQARPTGVNDQARQNAQQVMRQAQSQSQYSGQARPAVARTQGAAAAARPAQAASSFGQNAVERNRNFANDDDDDMEFDYLHNWDGEDNT